MISGEYRYPFLNKHRRLEKEQGLGKYGDLSIGCIALEMPLRHSSGDVQWAVSPVGLEFRVAVCAGGEDVEVIHTYTGHMRPYSQHR